MTEIVAIPSENRDRGHSFDKSLEESNLFPNPFLPQISDPNLTDSQRVGADVPAPRLTPKTRTDASDQAGTSTHKIAPFGFPGSSAVLTPTDDGTSFQKVALNHLQRHIQDAGDNPVKTVCFCPIRNRFTLSSIEAKHGNNGGKYYYFVITFDEGKIAAGFNQLVLRYKLFDDKVKEGFVKAMDLGVGESICIFNQLERKIHSTKITKISLREHVGRFCPLTNDTHLVVDLVITKINEHPCFPGNASVELRGGERVRMDALKIGDYVLSIHPTTGKPVYSRVYLWAHRDPHITATFLHITHPHGHLHISARHLILSGDQRRPVPADQLRVGDSIHFLSPCLSKQEKEGEGEGEERGDSHTLISVPVLHIQTCTQVGYYAPFTNNGLIVVDGIAASVYTNLSTHSQSDSSSWLWSGVWHSVTSGLVQQFGMQRVGQCVLTPVRVGCKLGMGSALSQQMDTNTHIHKYCQWLLKFCKL